MVGGSRGNRGSFAFGLSIRLSFNVKHPYEDFWTTFSKTLASIETKRFIFRAYQTPCLQTVFFQTSIF